MSLKRKVLWFVHHRYVLRVKMFVKFCLAVYTIYALWSAYVKIARTSVTLQMIPPGDQCIPFFDKVSKYRDENANAVKAAYDYVNSVALVRICANFTSTVVTAALGGASRKYDPLTQLGCSLAVPATKNEVINHCESKAVNKNCSEVVSTSPFPNGYDWVYTAERLSTDNCAIRFTPLNPPLDTCNYQYVGSYREEYPLGTTIVVASILIPIFVVGTQLIAFLFSFWKLRIYMWAWVMEGILAPLLYVFWYFYYKKRNFPKVQLHWSCWILLFLTTAAEGLITPIVYWKNCGLDRFPTQKALIILKIAQLVFITIAFWVPFINDHCFKKKQQRKFPTDGQIKTESSIGNDDEYLYQSESDVDDYDDDDEEDLKRKQTIRELNALRRSHRDLNRARNPKSDEVAMEKKPSVMAPVPSCPERGDVYLAATDTFFHSLPAVLKATKPEAWQEDPTTGYHYSFELEIWYCPKTRMVCDPKTNAWRDPNELQVGSANFSSVF